MLKIPLLLIAAFITCSGWANDRPNILLMMVDDLGFADFGCYGSEIETPNIDQLAESGLRFSQFYNTAKCHSSRIALLTAQYVNQADEQNLTRATTIVATSTLIQEERMIGFIMAET
jgi:arylsulfatase A-like enzyme